MGVSIGKAQWSYHGFSAFRQELARLEGIELEEMQGFGGQRPWDEYATDLRPLLDHSDCDGDLSPEECAQVWPRLAKLVSRLSRDYDRVSAAALVESMRAAAESGRRLEFR